MSSAAANPTEGRLPVRRALISVYDKTGLEELARGLHEAGVALVGTGNTHRIVSELGLPITSIEEVTGFPECLDGRVKTLHPRVHAGILADRRLEDHRRQLEELGIEPFDLVVSNLYPFRETLASGASEDDIVEKIDIGGPSMVRAAAKNHHSVAIVVNPARYGELLEAVGAGGLTLGQRKRLAAEAYRHTAEYDIAVSGWFAAAYAPASDEDGAFPDFTATSYELANVLRYGENPHQRAALYTVSDGAGSADGPGLAQAEQLHGKEMSYNNYTDTDAARRAAFDHEGPCVAIIKHANPCGIAVGSDIAEAHRKAHACDPLSAFGGVIAANRPVSKEMAEQVAGIFTEVIVAPGYEDGALEVLTKKKNIRVLTCPAPAAGNRLEVRPISGGALVQDADAYQAAGDDPASWTLAAGDALTEAELADLAFAWRSVRAVKSNAILLAKDGASVGVGMGQVNRVDSAKLAVQRAGEERAAGSYAASDAFFPFADGLEVLIEGGVKAVVQPGGSVRDEEVVEAARKAGVTLYLTGTRHFFH
ncbi:bifunctional phosphoribosylaminoimidazolecarboxamide formyltransferase/IMP cyclohydrolase [Mangrovactinospora gilvigrisea]|uniref:Bifunctional purine biosynthesis protein PurH n=1 Tax=Mangrovactinospora gilvigrisea TaxID=1428644 RepID=A0A1J7BDG0_9ACTN|nr:bifunctional phosphoribosylaminoimidazolecarboxamide formyltransferase/IMP cyclohydrolase [Mangrovactinospora gilvigrisea]OIV36686.1 bifunctional phosphoribosylaminoimidazolecarboxamide formyltransferase/IMP cyclohydrolase [Mangrovactinospora gilvigrisea]